MERQLLRPSPIVVVAILLVSACGGEQDPVAGRALEGGAPSEYVVAGIAALPPGEEVSIMLTPLRNTTDAEVVIRRLEPLGVSVTASGEPPAEVASLQLAPRDAALAEAVPLGFYRRSPPAVDVAGACVEQRAVAPDGYVLDPEGSATEDVYLLLGVRTRAAGTFRLEGQRVVYEVNGVLYRQDFRDALELEVREGAEPELPDAQAACIAR